MQHLDSKEVEQLPYPASFGCLGKRLAQKSEVLVVNELFHPDLAARKPIHVAASRCSAPSAEPAFGRWRLHRGVRNKGTVNRQTCETAFRAFEALQGRALSPR
ncbi:MAG: hypothetical protein P4M07_00990 [Xanthobacteraceae bacterium]|nr:hypothetical protein [Xanthobacteraceae bacterium]